MTSPAGHPGRVDRDYDLIVIGPGCLLHLNDSSEVTATHLLVAAGRVPVTGGLGLDAAGIRVNERSAVAVDRHLATTVHGVYAAGDVPGLMPFTHAAYAMGRIAACNAIRRRGSLAGSFSAGGIPQVVFTDPEVAQAGLTEEQAASVRGAGRWPSSRRRPSSSAATGAAPPARHEPGSETTNAYATRIRRKRHGHPNRAHR